MLISLPTPLPPAEDGIYDATAMAVLLMLLALLCLTIALESDGTLASTLTVSQARAALAGHHVLFVGDSVSRDAHFAMVAWLLDCNATAAPTPSATPSPAATPGPLLRADICFAAVTRAKNFKSRITIVGGGVGLPDFAIRFAGAMYADSVGSTVVAALESRLPAPEVCWPPGHELCRVARNASLLPSPGLRVMSDLIVANTGLWHLINPRTPDDFYNMSGCAAVMVAALTATPALAAQTRERVVWRTITLPEVRVKFVLTRFDNHSVLERATVTRANADATRVLRSAGISVFDTGPYFPPGAGVTTVDGLHPTPAVHVALLLGLLQAARPFWVGAPSATPVSSSTQRAVPPHAPGASDAPVVVLFGNRREGAVWYHAASAFPFVAGVLIPMVACVAAWRPGWFSTEQTARG